MDRVASLENATRIGFAARGLLYFTIGFLVIRAGRTVSQSGALEYLNTGSGKVAVAVMALGFVAYGVWRLTEALVDSEGHGSDAKGLAARAGGVVSGLTHIALAYAAGSLATGIGVRASGDPAERGAAMALSLPGGVAMLWVAAVILIGTGAYQMLKAVRLGFLRYIDANAARSPAVKWIGRLGYAARGVVFVAMGVFLIQAARRAKAAEAGGIDQVLDWFPESLQIVVAAGLALFGVFSLVEARYRRITDHDVIARLKGLAT